jgi:predicted Rossmann fold nucleotide-binding protein DprA/Smf involved in DNA uptake
VIVQSRADAEATLLVCSSLALPNAGSLRPLRAKGWARVRERAAGVDLEPGDMLALDADELGRRLGLDDEWSARLAGLLARRGQLAMELERLSRLGIWVTTLADERYPTLLADRLGDLAPPVLFGLGERGLLGRPGLAIVGSREAGPDAMDIARTAGELAARQGWVVVSGAARGVDTAAMRGAFDADGAVVGLPADGLERHLRDATVRSAAAEGRVVYLSPYRPDAPFSVGAAMGRNRLIYCLSRVAFIVHSSAGTGGTWAGAVEALEHSWVPTYVLDGDAADSGNRELVERGARPLGPEGLRDLAVLEAVDQGEHDAADGREAVQQTLF